MLSRAIQAAARRVGVHIIRENAVPAGTYPYDFTAAESALCLQVRPYTLTSPERIVTLSRACEHLVRNKIAGAFVELGVWKGGSAMVMAKHDRPLWLYDVWRREDWPEPAPEDGPGAMKLWEKYRAGEFLDEPRLEDVRSRLGDRPRYVQGLVENTVPAQAPDRIALLRVDTDHYTPVKHALTHLWPRLVSGGILIVDDYGCAAYPGAKRATDEVLGGSVFLARIDSDGVVAVKP